MEKLTVRNFGPIKEAEIDLTKYVVFIGDTSTGKSVLGKLISIFREFSNILNNKVENLDFNKELKFQEELKNFNIDFNYKNSFIEYFDKDLNLKLENEIIEIVDDSRSKKSLPELKDDLKSLDALLKVYDLTTDIFSKIGVKDKNVYFPPERILTSLIGSSISGLWANNVALPKCLKNFAAKFEVARSEIKIISFPAFNFTYKFEKGEGTIINSDNNMFNLNQASSGIQSLLPLLIVLEYELLEEYAKTNLNMLVEEPEISLFPIKQKKLLEYIISKLFNTNHKLIITTHSPYILTVLDTFILAKNTLNEHPNLKEEINAIVSESNWIDYNDISVYEVRNDGKVYSIKNEEFKSIDTNAIDGVSDIISEEFDKLTELRYAH